MAVATNAAAKAFPPPSSTFGELLRRSRFASYDPAIAQTYTSPQAHARRGDYGLKRPIPMPYKDSYITVNQFEHHAQFTEWNNAEPLVKFIKRIEELNLTPRNLPGKDWEKSLGEARTQWLIDSEFAQVAQSEPVDGLGRRGEGAYGARRPPPQQDDDDPPIPSSPSQLNVASLSPRQFKRYLDKLRQLSPEFREYLLEQQKARVTQNLQDDSLKGTAPTEFHEDDAALFIASQSRFHNLKLHRSFLAKHFSVTSPPIPTSETKKITTPTVAVSENIERQPHRIGGLMYTHYSPLDTVLTTQPQPGFIFQEDPLSHHFMSMLKKTLDPKAFVALLAGLVAKMKKIDAGTHIPFYFPEHDIAVGGKDLKALAEAAATAALDAQKAKAKGGDEDIDENPEPEISTVSTKESSKHLPSTYVVPDADDPLRVKRAQAKLRVLSIGVQSPPTMISTYKSHTSRPKDILKSISLSAEAAVDVETNKRFVNGNEYRIGSMEYSGHVKYDPRNRYSMSLGGNPYVGRSNVYTRTAGTGAGAAGTTNATEHTFGVDYTKPSETLSRVLGNTAVEGAKHRKVAEHKWHKVVKVGSTEGRTNSSPYGYNRGAARTRVAGNGVGGVARAMRNERMDGRAEDVEGVKKVLTDIVDGCRPVDGEGGGKGRA